MNKPLSKLLILLFILLSHDLFGQAIYTDVVPDQKMTENKEIKLDLNGDSLIDIVFTFNLDQGSDTWSYLFKVKAAENVQFAGSGRDVLALESFQMIDDNLAWSNSSTYLLSYNSGYGHERGNWYLINEGFIGVRIKDDNQTNYAWIRLNTTSKITFWIADFAYNSNADEGIRCGSGIPSGASSVFGSDNSDYLDPRDVRFSFTKAYDESDLSAYHVMIAKADDSAAYNLEYMNQLPEERYRKIMVDSTKSDYIFTGKLSATDVDIKGDPIKQLTNYKIHVLNISKSGIPENNYFSTPSKAFYLQAFPDAVLNPVAFDNGNTHTTSDIEVTFDTIEFENFIDEYRIFVSPADEATDISVDDLLNLGENYYTPLVPKGSRIDQKLNPDQVDVNGDEIISNLPYSVVVVSVADSSFSYTSKVSGPSRSFILKAPDDFKAGQKQGEYLSYHEINPAVRIGGDTTGFDVDRDGVDDIEFVTVDYGSPMFWVTRVHLFPKGNNEILLCEHSEHPNWTACLSENHQISEDYKWSNKKTIIYDYVTDAESGENHTWGHMGMDDFYVGEFYVGVRLMDRESPVYAWVHMEKISYISHKITEVAFFDISSGVDEINESNLVQVYPNPASNFITIKLTLGEGHTAAVKLYNSTGLLMDSHVLNERINNIDLKNYSPGIYYCTVDIKGEETETHKIIVY